MRGWVGECTWANQERKYSTCLTGSLWGIGSGQGWDGDRRRSERERKVWRRRSARKRWKHMVQPILARYPFPFHITYRAQTHLSPADTSLFFSPSSSFPPAQHFTFLSFSLFCTVTVWSECQKRARKRKEREETPHDRIAKLKARQKSFYTPTRSLSPSLALSFVPRPPLFSLSLSSFFLFLTFSPPPRG
jgi:hypothetical protein